MAAYHPYLRFRERHRSQAEQKALAECLCYNYWPPRLTLVAWTRLVANFTRRTIRVPAAVTHDQVSTAATQINCVCVI